MKDRAMHNGIGVSGEICSLASQIERMPGALKAKELAALLGLGRAAVYSQAQAGIIPSLRLGKMVRFDPHRIAEWLRKREVAAPEA
jgi:excisionase family DNA binding protein